MRYEVSPVYQGTYQVIQSVNQLVIQLSKQ